MTLSPDGRLQREGVELEMNAYCRRAVSQGVELAAAHSGRCVVFTLGPPAAEDILREAVAWGGDEGVLVSDPAFAGSDILATAKALAAALRHHGSWDLILVGRNSIDADTGQVGPQVAERLHLPFAGGVRQLKLAEGFAGSHLRAGRRLADRPGPVAGGAVHRRAAVRAVQGPSPKAGPKCRPTGSIGSVPPTSVPAPGVRTAAAPRWARCARWTSTVEASCCRAPSPTRWPRRPGYSARGVRSSPSATGKATDPVSAAPGVEAVETASGGTGPGILVVAEPGRARLTREAPRKKLARLARGLDGSVTAVGPAPLDPQCLAGWGADAAVELVGAGVEEDVAVAVADWCEEHQPWAGFIPGTLWGREVAARMAVRLDAGLTGDAVGFGIDGGRLVAGKPAFGGRLVAAITASSPLQLATVRPGILSLRTPRVVAGAIEAERVTLQSRGRLEVTGEGRDDEIEALLVANTVVSVGTGVSPDDYPKLQPLIRALGAELAATRKVTDKGWLPRPGESASPARVRTPPCSSPSASPASSTTWSGSGGPAPSWPSTTTPKRRCSMGSTSGSWPNGRRWCRSSPPRWRRNEAGRGTAPSDARRASTVDEQGLGRHPGGAVAAQMEQGSHQFLGSGPHGQRLLPEQVVEALLVDDAEGRLGEDRAGCDGIDGDVVWAELLRRIPGSVRPGPALSPRSARRSRGTGPSTSA